MPGLIEVFSSQVVKEIDGLKYGTHWVWNVYLTISRRRPGDYKPIFTEPKAKSPNLEATNCFSKNFQVFTNNNQQYFYYKNSLQIYYRMKKKTKSTSDYHFRDTESGPIRMQEKQLSPGNLY